MNEPNEIAEPAANGERVVVAMSGGVDSSVACLLMQQRGYDVVGLFLKNGVSREGPAGRPTRQGCCSVEDAHDARRIANQLGVPFYALDYGEGFGRLIDHFVDAYANGLTPSPCVLCNTWLKFGSLLEFAREIDATAVVTGHYAIREAPRKPGGRFRLRRAVDRNKDQAYFLSSLSQEQLRWARFPLGGMTKPEVRAIAREAGLFVAEKAESFEICFVPEGDYRKLLQERRPQLLQPGPIVTTTGERVGTHQGYAGFTVGQRRGVGVAMGTPIYVTEVDPVRNAVIVGPREALLRSTLRGQRMTWVSAPAPPIGERFACRAQIRHRTPSAPAWGARREDGSVHVELIDPVSAVAPGQALALYDREQEDLVLAGGWIADIESSRPVTIPAHAEEAAS